MGPGWARLGVQPDEAGPDRVVSEAGEVTEGHSLGRVQAGQGSSEKGQGQPGLALPCPLLQCDLGCQSSSAKRAGVPSGAPAVCVGGWGRGQDRGGPPQHRAELAATTGTPRAAKLRQTNQRSFHSASYVHRFLSDSHLTADSAS